MPDLTRTAKLALRDQLLAARRRIPGWRRAGPGARTAQHLLATEEVRRAATVAAYVSVSHEPGTGPLLEALAAAGTRVLLPVVLPDLDLDWAAYAGPQDLHAARGLLEPGTARLGVDAVAGADVVLVPGPGRRSATEPGWAAAPAATTGRWPGCRAARSPASCCTAASCSTRCPREPHDRPVRAAVTPDGVVRLLPGA